MSPAAKGKGKKVAPAAEQSSLSAVASAKTRTTAPAIGTSNDSDRPFVVVSEDLCGLIVASWLTPSVKHPFKLLPSWVIAFAVQVTFIAYMISMVHDETNIAHFCNTPALLQLCAVYIFGVEVCSNHTSIMNLQLALYSTRFRLADSDEVSAVRPTTGGQRCLLGLLPMIDLCVETAVFVVGVIFLMSSGSIGDVILNSVAVNFISDIDEAIMRAFVSPLSKQRLAKYHFESLYGVEAGATRASDTNRHTRRANWLSSKYPILWLTAATAVVASGQLVALGRATSLGENSTCTVLFPRRA